MSKIFPYVMVAVLLSMPLWCSTQTQIDTLIQFKKHALHFTIIEGQGTPILFEAGNGDGGEVWEDLLLPLHQATGATLITYDRAGLGKSSIDTTTINFKGEVKNLERALRKLGYKQDVFVVTHSFGAFYANLFARRNHRKVKGAVYIDPALPCFFTKQWAGNFVKTISSENWSMIKTHKRGLYHVLQNLPSITAKMSDKPLPAQMPVTVIAAEYAYPTVELDEVSAWEACLQAFGGAPNHKYILAKGADHKVWATQKELVVKEISALYEEVGK